MHIYKILVRKHEGKGSLGIPGGIWERNIKTDLKGENWNKWVQDRFQRRVLVKR
jgi:hypothetical protein